MRGNTLLLRLLLLSLLMILSSGDLLMDELFRRIAKLQQRKTSSWRKFPPRDATQEGLFNSEIHLNFPEAILRRDFSVPDLNGFTTMFVISNLLQVKELQYRMAGLDEMVDAGVRAVGSFRDGNHLAPVMSFWPRKRINGVWSAWPPNLYEPIDQFETFSSWIEWVCSRLGLSWASHFIRENVANLQWMVDAFHIPGDFDDTGCALALGGWLKSANMTAPFLQWNTLFSNASLIPAVALKYAYTPWSREKESREIDPRTYYWARRWLNSAAANRTTEEVRLVTTWAMKGLGDIGVNAMPFNVNNVDVSVASNFVYGILNAVVFDFGNITSQLEHDAAFAGLVNDTVSLLVHSLETGLVFERPDLTELYYPNIYDFIWMQARILRLLEDHPNASLKFPLLVSIAHRIRSALETQGSSLLLKMAHHELFLGHIYWENFLRDGDDRLSSTSLALNALFDTWTTRGDNCRRWRNGTLAPQVRDVVHKALGYLRDNILILQPMNSFFSGSVKSAASLPFFYPSNNCTLQNGTKIDPQALSFPPGNATITMKCSFSGSVSNDDYLELLWLPWFGEWTPQKFAGFNANDSIFPFWSSAALTYSSAMVVFANEASMCSDALKK